MDVFLFFFFKLNRPPQSYSATTFMYSLWSLRHRGHFFLFLFSLLFHELLLFESISTLNKYLCLSHQDGMWNNVKIQTLALKANRRVLFNYLCLFLPKVFVFIQEYVILKNHTYIVKTTNAEEIVTRNMLQGNVFKFISKQYS